MPAQWDESQTIGRHEDLLAGPMANTPDRADGMVGLTSEEYGVELARFAESAATRWHVMQIANFHPVYAAGPQDPRQSFPPRVGIGHGRRHRRRLPLPRTKRTTPAFRARVRGVRLTESYSQGDSHFITLESGADISGLSLMLPDNVASVQDKSTLRGLANPAGYSGKPSPTCGHSRTRGGNTTDSVPQANSEVFFSECLETRLQLRERVHVPFLVSFGGRSQ